MVIAVCHKMLHVECRAQPGLVAVVRSPHQRVETCIYQEDRYLRIFRSRAYWHFVKEQKQKRQIKVRIQHRTQHIEKNGQEDACFYRGSMLTNATYPPNTSSTTYHLRPNSTPHP